MIHIPPSPVYEKVTTGAIARALDICAVNGIILYTGYYIFILWKVNMIDVEAEVGKYKNCRDRDELGRQIKNYKSLALQYASNLVLAGQYSNVAHRLQEICDKLPAPQLIKYPAGSKRNSSVKTATITNEEQARISADWKNKTKK